MDVNGARTLKRSRRSQVEIAGLQCEIYNMLWEDHPQTVRHVYYRACSVGLVDKDQAGYRTVQQQLLKMREDGMLPWEWVADGTRVRRQHDSFGSKAEAVEHIARYYRQDIWRRNPVYVEVWCESDSMAGVLIQETDRYNVPLMVSRGFSSKTYLYRAAKDIEAEDRPAFLYYVGDWDPSGKLIPEKIEESLRHFAPDSEIHFERILVTPEQIMSLGLQARPPKRTTHSKNFVGGTVEAEAVPAATARNLLRAAIEQHLDTDELRVMEVAEESERQFLFGLASTLKKNFK